MVVSQFVNGLNMNPDHYTDAGKRVLDALDELEVAQVGHRESSIVHWAGILVEAAGLLASSYLGNVACSLAGMEALANGDVSH